jgi:hypothetical protein
LVGAGFDAAGEFREAVGESFEPPFHQQHQQPGDAAPNHPAEILAGDGLA